MYTRILTLLLGVLLAGTLTGQTAGKTYYLQSQINTANYVVGVRANQNANGAQLELMTRKGLSGQKITLEDAGGGYFYFRTGLGRYVHVEGVSSKPKARALLWAGKGADNTKWKFVPVGGGVFLVQSRMGTWLDVQWGVGKVGTPLWMWERNNGPAQRFKLSLVSSSAVTPDNQEVLIRIDPSILTKPQIFTPAAPTLHGWVDLHAHPMSHLAFGGKALHGAPDIDVLMPVISNDCSRQYARPRTLQEALGTCNATHGGHDLFSNTCGDHKRKTILRMVEKGMGAAIAHQEEGARGYPEFKYWPANNNLTHQQMYVGWIKRNYDHGQRVMVALSVNNASYSAAFSGPGDRNPDDAASSDVQIQEMRRLVGRYPWMEIALTAADVRRIVGANKLAIVLGIEVDNIGNLHKDPTVNPFIPSTQAKDKVRREVRRLYDQGIRYIFPVHVVDNFLAGTAVYEGVFNVSNYHQTGRYWDLDCASGNDNISFTYSGSNLEEGVMRGMLGTDIFRNPPDPPNCSRGHVNRRGLTPLGVYGVKEMMKLGMLIDMDHMSQNAVNQTLEIGRQFSYPMNSGHNSLRTADPNHGGVTSERNFTAEQYRKIFALGGMAGIGTSKLNAATFGAKVQALTRVPGGNVPMALGTDANGMEPLPSRRPGSNVQYNSGFPMSTLGNQRWDYNTVGVAHYGLYADFLKDLGAINPNLVKSNIMGGAEYFAKMWELCDRNKGAVR